jgi:hypothetical protein
MSNSLKQMWKESPIGVIVLLILTIFVIYYFMGYLSNKGNVFSMDMMSNNSNPAYKNKNSPNSQPMGPTGVRPSDALGHNEVFASVNGISTPSRGIPTSCSKPNIQNPSELLPKDNNNQWAQLNPQGKGDLANINLLKAGYHIGIDTIGQSLRNANLQIRSEPPNPQLSVGPWNLSTITPDFLRVPMEIGAGGMQ